MTVQTQFALKELSKIVNGILQQELLVVSVWMDIMPQPILPSSVVKRVSITMARFVLK